MLITNPLSILNAVKMRNEAVIHLEISDELGYLVDAIVNEDKIGTFDKRPNDLSLEVKFGNLALFFYDKILNSVTKHLNKNQGQKRD